MKVYKVTKQQLKNLQEKGSILVGGITYQYDETALYVLDDPTAPEYRIVWSSADKTLNLRKDGVDINEITIGYASAAGTAGELRSASGSGYFNADNLRAELDEIKASAGGVTANRQGKTLIIS